MVIFKNLFQYTAIVIVLQDRPTDFYDYFAKLFFSSRKKERIWRKKKPVDLWNMGVISPVYQKISLINYHSEII